MYNNTQIVKEKFELIKDFLDDQGKRVWAAIEAQSFGWGGITKISEATGLSRTTIKLGISQLDSSSNLSKIKSQNKKLKNSSMGRKTIEQENPQLLQDLSKLLEIPSANSILALKWICKSTNSITQELIEKGYKISNRKVAQLLKNIGYKLTLKPTNNGTNYAIEQQFNYINNKINYFIKTNQPIILLDINRRELTENYYSKNNNLLEELIEIEINFDKDNLLKFVGEYINSWWKNLGTSKYLQTKEILFIVELPSNRSLNILLDQITNFVQETKLTAYICFIK